ncbi:hypothetical protein [Anabaena sp. 54]|uniref:hypothetical protein n=1 Tax=Anabaena sp. 54 TaxID=46231 RepID=UPI00345DD048
MSETPFVIVNFTDNFKQKIRSLSKKYRHIRNDIQPIIEELQSGNFLGDQLQEQGIQF